MTDRRKRWAGNRLACLGCALTQTTNHHTVKTQELSNGDVDVITTVTYHPDSAGHSYTCPWYWFNTRTHPEGPGTPCTCDD